MEAIIQLHDLTINVTNQTTSMEILTPVQYRQGDVSSSLAYPQFIKLLDELKADITNAEDDPLN